MCSSDLYPEGAQYQMLAPMDESPIDMEKVVAMYEQLLKSDVQMQRELIRNTVKEEADIKAVMRPVAEFFEEKKQRRKR